MDLSALEIFRTVAKEGGISKAARKLNRVQSNVTTRVKQFEQDLGVNLFERHHRQLTLSESGKRLLPYAEQILQLASQAKASVTQSGPYGTLRLGILESAAASRLPPVLSAYHRACPEVRVEVVTGTSGALISRLEAYDVEAAVVAEPFVASGVDSEVLFEEELVLIGPPGTPKPLKGRAKATQTLIAFSQGCSYRRRLEEWFGRRTAEPGQLIELQSYHAIVACVAAGTGVAIVPRSVLEVTAHAAQLSVHSLPTKLARSKTHLIWRKGHHSLALQALRRQFNSAG